MAKIEHTFETPMDQETALEVTKDALDSYVNAYKKYSPIVEWKNNKARFGFKVMGSLIRGLLTIEDGNGHIYVEIPALFMGFKDKVIDGIEGQIKVQMDARGIPYEGK